MKNVLVKFTQSQYFNSKPVQPGETLEVSESEAEAIVALGIGEIIKPPKAPKPE